MTAEKQNKLLGICASLGLHGLAAALLIFGLSGNAMVSLDAGKFDFVRVSLAAGENDRQKTPLTAIRKGAAPEIPAIQSIHAESGTMVQVSPTSADDEMKAFPETRTVAYAAAGGHDFFSDAGRRTAAPEGPPAFSNAYPIYRENPPPGYPEIARQRGYEGVVLIAAEILADGRVGRAVVSQSSGYAILDQTAMKAVMAWKFEPAKKSGIPYKTWAELPIKFVLNNHLSQS